MRKGGVEPGLKVRHRFFLRTAPTFFEGRLDSLLPAIHQSFIGTQPEWYDLLLLLLLLLLIVNRYLAPVWS